MDFMDFTIKYHFGPPYFVGRSEIQCEAEHQAFLSPSHGGFWLQHEKNLSPGVQNHGRTLKYLEMNDTSSDAHRTSLFETAFADICSESYHLPQSFYGLQTIATVAPFWVPNTLMRRDSSAPVVLMGASKHFYTRHRMTQIPLPFRYRLDTSENLGHIHPKGPVDPLRIRWYPWPPMLGRPGHRFAKVRSITC